MKTWQEIERQEFITNAKADAKRFSRLEHELKTYIDRIAEWNKSNPKALRAPSALATLLDEMLEERACCIAISIDKVERVKNSADPSRTCKPLTEPFSPVNPPHPSTDPTREQVAKCNGCMSFQGWEMGDMVKPVCDGHCGVVF